MKPGEAQLPTGEAKRVAVRQMFDRIAPRYDLVNRLMTFGLDAGWRRRTIDLLALERGAVVGDVACGTGDFARMLTERGFRPVGLDLSLGMLHQARTGGAPVVCADAATLPVASGALDGAVSGFAVRNFASLDDVIGDLARVIRPGGRLAVLELATPPSPLVRFGHSLWCRFGIPTIGAILSDADAYRYLPRSVAYLPSHDDLARRLNDAGFASVCQHLLSGGIVQVVTATRTPAAVPRREAVEAVRSRAEGQPS